jgi:hypothetical protein
MERNYPNPSKGVGVNREALAELRKIIQIPDQKHWNCFKMREQALEEWLEKWVIDIKAEQSVLNLNKIPSEVEDTLKEQLVASLLDQLMTDVAHIDKKNNTLVGELVCLRRRAKS